MRGSLFTSAFPLALCTFFPGVQSTASYSEGSAIVPTHNHSSTVGPAYGTGPVSAYRTGILNQTRNGTSTSTPTSESSSYGSSSLSKSLPEVDSSARSSLSLSGSTKQNTSATWPTPSLSSPRPANQNPTATWSKSSQLSTLAPLSASGASYTTVRNATRLSMSTPTGGISAEGTQSSLSSTLTANPTTLAPTGSRPTCHPSYIAAINSGLPTPIGNGSLELCDACPKTSHVLDYSSLPIPHSKSDYKAYAASCNAAWLQYSSASSSWWELLGVRHTRTLEVSTRTTIRVLGHVVDPTTLADGFTRQKGIKGDPSVWKTDSIQTVKKETFLPSSVSTSYHSACLRPEHRGLANVTASFPNTKPACAITPHQCSHLEQVAEILPKTSAICGTSAFRYSKCHIDAQKVDVFYWPTATQAPPAKGGHTTPAPSSSVPFSVVSNGYTFVSPSIYLSLEGLGIRRTWIVDSSISSTESAAAVATNTIMALAPELLSSVVYTIPGCEGLCPDKIHSLFSTPLKADETLHVTAQRYDPATVNKGGPVPASAYFWGKVDAGHNWGRVPLRNIFYSPVDQVIWDDYLPQVAAPDELRSLDPAYKDCGLGVGGIYDPPIALTAADSPVTPTLTPPGGPPSETPTSASPAGPITGIPAPTAFQGAQQSVQGPAPQPSSTAAQQPVQGPAPQSSSTATSSLGDTQTNAVGPQVSQANPPARPTPFEGTSEQSIAGDPSGSVSSSNPGSSESTDGNAATSSSTPIIAGAPMGLVSFNPDGVSVVPSSPFATAGAGNESPGPAGSDSIISPVATHRVVPLDVSFASASSIESGPGQSDESGLSSSASTGTADELRAGATRTAPEAWTQASATMTTISNVFGENVATAVLVGGHTVVANRPVQMVQGSSISLGLEGVTVFVNGAPAGSFPTSNAITSDSQNSAAAYGTEISSGDGSSRLAAVLYGETLVPGRSQMVHGAHTYSADNAGNLVIDGMRTVTVQPSAVTTSVASTTPASDRAVSKAVMALGSSQTLTVVMATTVDNVGRTSSLVSVDGSSATVGQTMTLDGKEIMIEANDIVLGSTTVSFSAAAPTTTSSSPSIIPSVPSPLMNVAHSTDAGTASSTSPQNAGSSLPAVGALGWVTTFSLLALAVLLA